MRVTTWKKLTLAPQACLWSGLFVATGVYAPTLYAEPTSTSRFETLGAQATSTNRDSVAKTQDIIAPALDASGATLGADAVGKFAPGNDAVPGPEGIGTGPYTPTADPKAGNEMSASTLHADAFAKATLEPKSGSQVTGSVRFGRSTTRDLTRSNEIIVIAEVNGATPGEHGFHIHEKGDCSTPDAKSAGEHFNPMGSLHGDPEQPSHHVGDLGNIMVDANGHGTLTITIPGKDQKGDDIAKILLGRAVILHASPDDLKSQPAGNAGARIACGVIEKTKGALAH